MSAKVDAGYEWVMFTNLKSISEYIPSITATIEIERVNSIVYRVREEEMLSG